MRGYMTTGEIRKISQKRHDLEIKIKKEDKELEKKYVEKHGSDKAKWSSEVYDGFCLGEKP